MQLKTLAYLRMRGMFDELRRIGYNPAKPWFIEQG